MLNMTAIGHIGNDAIIKIVNENQVINFSIAHSEKYKNANGVQVENTTWVECAFWTDSKVADYLKKGTQVYIAGTPESRAYVTKDGEMKSTLHLRVNKLELLNAKKEVETHKGNEAPAPPAGKADKKGKNSPASVVTSNDVNDDLPF